MDDTPAVLVAKDLELQSLRSTQLHDCWLQVHTPLHERDKSFESVYDWTHGQVNESVLESGRERRIDKVFATTWLLNSVTSIYPKRVDIQADHVMVLAAFSPPSEHRKQALVPHAPSISGSRQSDRGYFGTSGTAAQTLQFLGVSASHPPARGFVVPVVILGGQCNVNVGMLALFMDTMCLISVQKYYCQRWDSTLRWKGRHILCLRWWRNMTTKLKDGQW